MYRRWKAWWHDEAGQDLIEYSLLLAFLALAVVTLVKSVGGSIKVLGKLFIP